MLRNLTLVLEEMMRFYFLVFASAYFAFGSTSVSVAADKKTQAKINQAIVNAIAKSSRYAKKSAVPQNYSDAAAVNKLVPMLPGKYKNGKPQASFSTAPNLVGDPLPGIVSLCTAAYPGDPAQQQQCIADAMATLGANGVYTGSVGYVKYAVFPLTIPYYGSGECLYLGSPYLIGLACYGSSVDGVGGVYAACDIWNGCYSGYF